MRRVFRLHAPHIRMANGSFRPWRKAFFWQTRIVPLWSFATNKTTKVFGPHSPGSRERFFFSFRFSSFRFSFLVFSFRFSFIVNVNVIVTTSSSVIVSGASGSQRTLTLTRRSPQPNSHSRRLLKSFSKPGRHVPVPY